MIGLIDCGIGNVNAVIRMLEKVNSNVVRVKNAEQLNGLKKIILPGVGHFSEGVRALKISGLWDALTLKAKNKEIIIMGICLGMQLLCKYSEESHECGLGLVDASVRKFNFNENEQLKIPHMGWNSLRSVGCGSIFPENDEELRFYFAHSYKVVPNDSNIVIGYSSYGGEFCAAFQQDNLFGFQFHPEKSHRFGMVLMKRFVEL
jgi:glutamine amidotransferase